MEYYRTENNQIQASFAYRIGKIAHQYDQQVLVDAQRKYEATLYICLLQSLLTHCQELLRSMSKHERRASFLTATFSERESLWGLRESMIKINTFKEEKVRYETVLRHLRNALSHPTQIDINSPFPSTGFSTLGEPGEEISEFCFVSSPNVVRNRPKLYPKRELAEETLRKMGNPPDVEVKELIVRNETRYQLWQNNKPLARIFRIDVPVNSLKELVLGLSNHLAQPTQEIWDEVTINELIVA